MTNEKFEQYKGMYVSFMMGLWHEATDEQKLWIINNNKLPGGLITYRWGSFNDEQKEACLKTQTLTDLEKRFCDALDKKGVMHIHYSGMTMEEACVFLESTAIEELDENEKIQIQKAM